MKKLFGCFIALIFTLAITSCDGPKKASDNQQTSTPPVTTNDSAPRDVKGADQIQSEKFSNLTGAEIVENTAANLTRKLNLTNSQPSDVKLILTKSFTTQGGVLEKTYSAEESKKYHTQMVTNAIDPINQILNEQQKETFKKFTDRK